MNDDIATSTQTGHPPDDAETDDTITVGRVFDALSDHRRRYALYILSEHGTPMSVSALAERMAPWVHDVEPDDVTEEQIERTHVGLRHGQLPKLDDVGAIDYDRRHSLVSLDGIGPFEEYLDFAAAEERRE